MWYKKSYYDTTQGYAEMKEIEDAFCEFYDEEINTFPNKAKGLAMFGLNPQFFCSNSDDHYMAFFSKHGIESEPLQPEHLPKFICGDEEFAKSLPKKIDAK